MIQFYAPDIKDNPVLGEVESGHCCRVLRKREGDCIRVVDGCGGVYECEITDAHPKHTMLRVLDSWNEEKNWPFRVTLAVAPTKNIDRMEWLVEKAVEIGVDRIVLLQCDRSERKTVKTERIEKIMLSAMNQSLKSHKPELEEMMRFDKFLAQCGEGCYMGYCDENHERLDFSTLYHSKGGDATIIIGPEGDFSPLEVEKAFEAGVKAVTFGKNRLRTETAALYGITAVHALASLK